jgi:hypothetical protein
VDIKDLLIGILTVSAKSNVGDLIAFGPSAPLRNEADGLSVCGFGAKRLLRGCEMRASQE